jgi:hypothetical protein
MVGRGGGVRRERQRGMDESEVTEEEREVKSLEEGEQRE